MYFLSINADSHLGRFVLIIYLVVVFYQKFSALNDVVKVDNKAFFPYLLVNNILHMLSSSLIFTG